MLNSADAFHGKADAALLNSDPAVIATSNFFKGSKKNLIARYEISQSAEEVAALNEMEKAEQTTALAVFASELSEEERKLAATVAKPNVKQLAVTLAPLLGEKNASLVFGIGALAMAFSTMIILMMINGYAVAEVMGRYDSTGWRLVGALAACLVGFFWWVLWKDGQENWLGDSKTWLMIVASTFGAILLPIAYVAFFALMNSRKLLGDAKPTGWRMVVWNVLMAIGVFGAFVQAVGAILTRAGDEASGSFVIGGIATFSLLALVGFSARFVGGNSAERNSTEDGNE